MNGELMASEIREIPEALRCAHYSVTLPGPFKQVLLAARGSSDHAALYARYLIEARLRLPVALAAPWIVTRKGGAVYEDCLTVGISQSGAGPDVLAVIEAMRRAGHVTVGITNDASSPLASLAQTCVPLGVGPERSVAATKTYTSSLLALYELVHSLDDSLPSPFGLLPDDAWVESCYLSAQADAEILVHGDPIVALGRGYAYATAREAALKLIECGRIPCQAFSSADFEHGPKALVTGDAVAVAFSGERIAEGTTLFPPPTPSEIPEELIPIWHSIYAQWLAYWAARYRDLDPDSPPHLAKVTKTF